MKFLKEGFDVFVLESFEDKSGCRILDLLEFVKKMSYHEKKVLVKSKREYNVQS